MTPEEFKSQLAEFLMVDPSEMTNDANLVELGWDSLALLSVISLAEETWGIEVEEADLNKCQTVTEMLHLFSGYLTGTSA
jgi:acyl carrier protein